MRIGKIIYRLRLKQRDLKKRGKQATFGNYITGAAELSAALKNPPVKETAFVIPMGTATTETSNDSVVNQLITESFAVVICIKADNFQADKNGYEGNDRLHTIRDELFSSLLGWRMAEAVGIIKFAGGNMIDFSPSYIWYQYKFSFPARLFSLSLNTNISTADIEGGVVVTDIQDVTIESPLYIDKIYAQYILQPDAAGRLPLDPTQDLPLPDEYPDVKLPNIAQEINSEV